MLRREFLLAGASGLLARPFRPLTRRKQSQVEALERSVNGRLGFAARSAARPDAIAWRGDDRFPMCSTFKWLLAARVLARVDEGHEDLARMIHYGPADLLEYAPITRAHVQEGQLSVSTLCGAAIQYSDNTAANLLLVTVGGPHGLTSWLRRIGDRLTRLDRNEPALNTSIPGDKRDTTTPLAMVRNLDTLLLGSALRESSRQQLITWLVGNTTGDARLRAGLPHEWRIGDKTGTGALGSTNDVAIAWPASRTPVLMAAYLTQTTASEADRNHVLAELGRMVGSWISES